MKLYMRLHILTLGLLVTFTAAANMVTWDLGGRTGDQILSYCMTKWVASYLKIPLLIKPFQYSDQFVFGVVEQPYSPEKVVGLTPKGISLVYGKPVAYDADFQEQNSLFIIDVLFAHANWYTFDAEIKQNTIFPYKLMYNASLCDKGDVSAQVRFNHMHRSFKNNPSFFSMLRLLLQLNTPIKTMQFPDNMVSVAVHARKGGGFDLPCKSSQYYETSLNIDSYKDYFMDENRSMNYEEYRQVRKSIVSKISLRENPEAKKYVDIASPLKLPPHQYYIDQLKALDVLFDVPMFVYIFTDDPNPEEIVARYKEAVNSKNIIFSCRHEENNYYSNVLYDLFAMSTFDVLIRGYSSMSQVAQLLGNHKLVISPIHALWQNDKLIIDEILFDKSKDFNDFMNSMKEKCYQRS